ncbi:hypothetical protein [Metasolibacillus sp. FSL K6-0083]|uniref:VOC family protein n=1 Tax=Metasolibacillus sp. FSL K6-0083 TaxID=2921416 RepID=UPI00315A6B08
MNPILNQVGTVFIPVSNIEEARKWYCDILGLSADGEILFGHLYIVPMNGTEIEHNHWFNFKDPDGNYLMVCKC